MTKGFKRGLTMAAMFCAGFAMFSFQTGHSQSAPSGWTVQRGTALGWVGTSPYQGQLGRVRLIYYPVQVTRENFERWFASASESRTRAFGRITAVKPTTPPLYEQGHAPLLALMRTVRGNDGKDYFVESYAYDTVAGLQLIQIVSPTTIPESNAAYRAALLSVNTDWRARRYYQQGTTANSVQGSVQNNGSSQGNGSGQTADSSIPPPPAGKRNCRREPVWGWAVRYGCSPSAICNERVIKDHEWVCDD